MISRPSPAYCRRTAARVARLIAARALPVTARPSQAAGGTWASERMMSTSSPFSSSVASGLWLPLMRQPTQLSPMLGVHRIGKVDRCCPLRQGDELALRREAENLVVEQLKLGVFEELLRAFALR